MTGWNVTASFEFGLRRPLFQPGEKVEIGRLLRVPDLLDLADADAAELRQHMLHRTRRHADAKRARAELQERPTLRRGHIVHEKREIVADLRLVAGLELVDHLMQQRQPVQDRALRIARPDMRDRFRHFAHIVVGQRQQDRIDALGHEVAHERALEQLEGERARDHAHREAAIGIGRAAQIIRQDCGFVVIGMGVVKPVEEGCKGLHDANLASAARSVKARRVT